MSVRNALSGRIPDTISVELISGGYARINIKTKAIRLNLARKTHYENVLRKHYSDLNSELKNLIKAEIRKQKPSN